MIERIELYSTIKFANNGSFELDRTYQRKERDFMNDCKVCRELARSGWYHWLREYQGMSHDDARKTLKALGLIA